MFLTYCCIVHLKYIKDEQITWHTRWNLCLAKDSGIYEILFIYFEGVLTAFAQENFQYIFLQRSCFAEFGYDTYAICKCGLYSLSYFGKKLFIKFPVNKVGQILLFSWTHELWNNNCGMSRVGCEMVYINYYLYKFEVCFDSIGNRLVGGGDEARSAQQQGYY
eukprot:TRINITY_DN6490_c0_g2_i4.p3 TRINITY_DN6490_c0_g2~~TRINITY_DN6490_c0_g2_i4.p3  ORF type:complete len:163 (+),score=1.38 TRINITY_DN6490_c0_g2_i4:365-853(+)